MGILDTLGLSALGRAAADTFGFGSGPEEEAARPPAAAEPSPSDATLGDKRPLDKGIVVSTLEEVATKTRQIIEKAAGAEHERNMSAIESRIAGDVVPLEGLMAAYKEQEPALLETERTAAKALVTAEENYKQAVATKESKQMEFDRKLAAENQSREEKNKTFEADAKAYKEKEEAYYRDNPGKAVVTPATFLDDAEREFYTKLESEKKAAIGNPPVRLPILTVAELDESAKSPDKISPGNNSIEAQLARLRIDSVAAAEGLPAIKEAFDKANARHTEALDALMANSKKQEEVQQEITKVTSPSLQEIRRHNDQMMALADGTPSEEKKMASLMKHYETLLTRTDIKSGMKAGIEEALAVANMEKSADKFMATFEAKLHEKKIDPTKLVPNKLDWPDKSQDGVNLRLSKNEDGKVVVSYTRPVSINGDTALESIELNESGVLDMKQFAGKNITFSVDPTLNVDQKILLVNTENTKISYIAPHPGLDRDSNGTVRADNFGNPNNIVEVTGSDKKGQIALASAQKVSDYNDKYEARKEEIYTEMKIAKSERSLALLEGQLAAIKGRGSAAPAGYEVSQADRGTNHVAVGGPGKQRESAVQIPS